MDYHKSIIRETSYPVSFYLEDILYSLPVNQESLVLWNFLKRVFSCFLSIIAVLLVHLFVISLFKFNAAQIALNKDVMIEMSIVKLNKPSDTIIGESEDFHTQDIKPVKSEVAPLVTNNSRQNEYKQVKNKLSKPKISYKRPPIKKTVSEQNDMVAQPRDKRIEIKEAKNSNVSYITKPRVDANYLNNTKPEYPDLSIRLHEEGIVMLKVFVSSSGLAEQVFIEKSSGFERLDHSALLVVKKWRFIAAKQGKDNISSWVVVPVSFKLEDE